MSYSDRHVAGRIYSAFRLGIITETKIGSRDIRRFRLYDPKTKDVRLIGLASDRDLRDFWEYQARRSLPWKTDRVIIRDSSGKQRMIRSRWGDEDPIFFGMHSNNLDASISRRRPRVERERNPSGHEILGVSGAEAANILWDTPSFQFAMQRNPRRPVVGLLCDAGNPSAIFGPQFADRLFELGLRSPVHLGQGTVSAGEHIGKDGVRYVIAAFDEIAPGRNPIVTFPAPGTK